MEAKPVITQEAVTNFWKMRKSLFETLRLFHGSPRCMIERLTTTGEDSATGTSGTSVNSFANQVYECLVLAEPYDAKAKYVRDAGLGFTQSSGKFLIIYDVRLTTSDIITYPYDTTQKWEVTSVDYNSLDARNMCEIRPITASQ